jgi:hypothetical protein
VVSAPHRTRKRHEERYACRIRAERREPKQGKCEREPDMALGESLAMLGLVAEHDQISMGTVHLESPRLHIHEDQGEEHPTSNTSAGQTNRDYERQIRHWLNPVGHGGRGLSGKEYSRCSARIGVRYKEEFGSEHDVLVSRPR